MTYTVIVSQEADSNAVVIYDWIAERTVEGANRWYRAYKDALKELEQVAERCAAAHESDRLGEPLRQFLFRTRKGHPYRLIFKIVGTEVQVLYVRGFGQNDIR